MLMSLLPMYAVRTRAQRLLSFLRHPLYLGAAGQRRWKKEISEPFLALEPEALERLIALLKTIMVRHTKVGGSVGRRYKLLKLSETCHRFRKNYSWLSRFWFLMETNFPLIFSHIVLDTFLFDLKYYTYRKT
jgi:hypothetical protein